MRPPLSPLQAQRLLGKAIRPLPGETVPLEEALLRRLKRSVRAPHPYPRFHVSAMDGYAVRSTETRGASPKHPAVMPVAGSIEAGARRRPRLPRGGAFRIATGAPLPAGADAVVEQECVERRGGTVRLLCPVTPGRHVRRRGEGARRGAVVLPAGTLLTERHLALLASVGVGRVAVFRRPRVALWRTGSELVRAGRAPRWFSSFDANGPLLEGALRRFGAVIVDSCILADRPAVLLRALRGARRADCVLSTGGVSVGDRDLVRALWRKEGVKPLFESVRQKPGLPFSAGRKGRTLFLGLPGNPAAAALCFYVYVRPLLERLKGARGRPRILPIPLAESLRSLPRKHTWVRVKREKAGLRPLPGQGSHLLASLAVSDGVARIPPGRRRIPRGRRVAFLSWEDVPCG